MERHGLNIENTVMYLAIVTTVLSFSLISSVNSICSVIMYVFWGLTLFFQLKRKGFNIQINHTVNYIIVFYAIWFCVTKFLYTVGMYPSGGLGVVLFLPYCAFFYVVGFNCSEDALSPKVAVVFAASQAILMLMIFPQVKAIAEAQYLFVAKNQMGQMLGVGATLDLIVMPKLFKAKVWKIICYSIGGISLIALLLIHSRTPIVAMIIVWFVFIAAKKNKHKSDYITICITVAIAVAVIVYLGGKEFLMDLLAGRGDVDTIDVNNVTSGRWELWNKVLFEDFFSSPIYGIGAYAYVDNFIVNSLRCGGLMLTLPMIYFAYLTPLKIIRNAKKIENLSEDKQIFNLTVGVLVIFYLVVSLMEGYPPIGPGTSVFFLWLMLGLAGKQEIIK